MLQEVRTIIMCPLQVGTLQVESQDARANALSFFTPCSVICWGPVLLTFLPSSFPFSILLPNICLLPQSGYNMKINFLLISKDFYV